MSPRTRSLNYSSAPCPLWPLRFLATTARTSVLGRGCVKTLTLNLRVDARSMQLNVKGCRDRAAD
jgi:hypothetical protein